MMRFDNISTSILDGESLRLSRHFRQTDQESLWAQCEAKAPDLFIPELEESRVRAIDIVPVYESASARGDDIQSPNNAESHEGNVVQQISTIAELHRLLRVSYLELIFPFPSLPN